MKPRDRQVQIDEIIRRDGEVSVDGLSHLFDVSSETIRRDLAHLVDEGRAQKIHGGARRPRLMVEGSFGERQEAEAGAKSQIGHRLTGAIEAGETIFVDTGSTTLAAASALAGIAGLTVISNSFRLAERLTQLGSQASIYLLGGRYHGDNAETTGPSVIEQVAGFQADHAVISVAAVLPEIGVMDASYDEAQVARAMIGNARSLIVLADSSKFGKRAAFSVCRCERIDLLISDSGLAALHRAALGERGVEVWQ